MMHKACIFGPIAKNFCCLASTSSVQFFGHNGLYLYHLLFGGCDLPIIFGNWKFASTVAYCWPGGQLWVAILPDNCHPSS